MGWEERYRHALAIDLLDGEWEAAYDAGRARQRIRRDLTSGRWFPPEELTAHGIVCEAAFNRLIGERYEIEVTPRGLTRQPDAGPYEVKGSGWHKSETMIHWHGGHYGVPTDTRLPVVFMTCFKRTRTKRVFLDGWLPWNQVTRFPVGSGKGGKGRSYVVAYGGIRPWTELPEIG